MDARQALQANVDNPYEHKSHGPAGPDATDDFPSAWKREYLMRERNNECVRDVVETLAPSADHTRGIRTTAWVCQESLDGQAREKREHILGSFKCPQAGWAETPKRRVRGHPCTQHLPREHPNKPSVLVSIPGTGLPRRQTQQQPGDDNL